MAMDDFDKDITHAFLTIQVGRDHIYNPWQTMGVGDIFANLRLTKR